jgi:histidine decarboxylase
MENELTKNDFYLPPEGLSEDERREALRKFDQVLAEKKENFLGYQANQMLQYQDTLSPYLDCQLNNLGDPYVSGNFKVNSKCLEQAVLDYYAELWHGKQHDPDDPDSCWGYVLSMGSSEANLYGLWSGRDYLAGKYLLEPTEEEIRRVSVKEGAARVASGTTVHRVRPYGDSRALSPILFYSEDTHYSIIKSAIVLRLKTFYDIGIEKYPKKCPLPGSNGEWPRAVPSEGGAEGTGAIDVDKLAILVDFFARKKHPILINFNYGTTFKGAYDNIEGAWKKLEPIFRARGLLERKLRYDNKQKKQYDTRTGFWFHVDGALGAAYMPFLEMAHDKGLISQRRPKFDFRLDYVHSISMSGHKWIGAPWPCGIYMTKRRYQLRPPDNPEYIGALDSTFAGSRNGLSALIFWKYLAHTSYDQQIKKALHTQWLAEYAYRRLKHLEKRLKQEKRLNREGLWIARSPLSLTVRFKQARPEIIAKYSLSGETFYVNGRKRAYNHIFAMPHVTEETIERLIEDLSQPGAFPKQNADINSSNGGAAAEP